MSGRFFVASNFLFCLFFLNLMNTSHLIPEECVSPIMLENPDYSEFPFFSGTGFFVKFPPFLEIFFITARHCIIKDGEEKGDIKIPYHPHQENNEAIIFDEYFCTGSSENDELEDLLIYVVGNVSEDKKAVLTKRALRLEHQEDAATLLENLIRRKGKVRTVGFPGNSKDIDYEKRSAFARPRGFHGTVAGPSSLENRFRIVDINWKEGELEGFSGSPVLEFGLSPEGKILPVPIGVVLTGAANKSHFLSINVATDLIASYLYQKYQKASE
jgi:hypothetical protein